MDASFNSKDDYTISETMPDQRHRLPLRVLLVEDERPDALLVCDLLARSRRIAADVTVADTIGEAHRLLDQAAFDLLILDFWIGAESSLVLLDHPACLKRGAPALMISAVDVVDVSSAALGAGARGHLHKRELSPERLDAAIADALGV